MRSMKLRERNWTRNDEVLAVSPPARKPSMPASEA
jgi:hypothetical protein